MAVAALATDVKRQWRLNYMAGKDLTWVKAASRWVGTLNFSGREIGL